METINLIRLILGCLFISLGLITFVLETIGIYKLKYVLNKMHFAGTGDTCGLLLTVIGTVIINGFDFSSLKLVLVLTFFWFASPVSSHLISRLVIKTDKDLEEHVKVCTEEESQKLMEGEE